MISGISGAGAYYSAYRPYTASAARSVRTEQAENTQNAHKAAGLWTSRRSAGPDVPVEPVRPVTAVDPRQTQPHVLSIREGADPVEMAVRMRIEYLPQDAGQTAAQEGVLPEAIDQAALGIQGGEAAPGAESAQQAAEEGKCETCEERKYQDGSDDMGVSYQTPTRIDPDMAASAVRGHEMEHVVREQAKAQREDRKVVSQSVTLHTNICPECGKAYVSGGTTRTTTASASPFQQAPRPEEMPGRVPFSAVA